MPTSLRTVLAVAALAALAPSAADAGQQSPLNRYRAAFTRIYGLDGENGQAGLEALTPAVSITTSAAEVIEGLRSVKLEGPAVYARLPIAALGLQPNRYYTLEFRYRVLRAGPIGVVLWSPGAGAQEFLPLGELPARTGDGSMSMSVGVPGVTGSTFLFYAINAAVSLDAIAVDAQAATLERARLPLVTAAFPRLGDYMLLGPSAIASMHGQDPAEAERLAARFDLLAGAGFDQTTGAAAWVRRVRTLNPSLLLLPYRQAFMAQFDSSGGLQAEFNAGLADAWFMRSPSGALLGEPLFPQNVQLNHTPAAPTINGQTFADYSSRFLATRTLPSGLWNGVLFDQAEWFINPLLGWPAPAIDLNRDGVADATAVVQRAWNDGFHEFFRTVRRRFGPSPLLLGNAGFIAANPTAIGAVNGWIAERAMPYGLGADGDWDTTGATEWYKFLDTYLLASRRARAPQVPLLEFSGVGLGQPTGTVTPNGAPLRVLTLESRDYRRMRLGLTTALLGEGFFEYDFVDNTTPAVWFDEFAVDGSGTATTSASGKGYLGVPLGDATEIAAAARVVWTADFESSAAPAGLYLNGRVSTAPAEVVSGTASLVATKSEAAGFSWFAWWAGAVTPGRTYQLRADYRILSSTPSTFQGLAGIGFLTPSGQLPAKATSSLYMADVDGPGQRGTLRVAVKATTADSVLGYLADVGTIAVDNLQLVEGAGGVWRRDFENGIALVNPTPEPLTVTLAQIAGPRGRTNVRRIRGAQVPAWNTGQPVPAAGLTLPSGDGIVLLADRLAAAAPGAPGTPIATVWGTTATVTWPAAGGYPAGYQVSYGERAGGLSRVTAAGRDARVVLDDLLPGATYTISVSAYDHRGQLGPPAPVTSVTVPGATSGRPQFTFGASLAPGAVATITGTQLADASLVLQAPYPASAGNTRVEVNGVPAPLVSVSPSAVTFVAPWELTGADAVVNVVRGQLPGREQVVPVVGALPQLLASGSSVAAFHLDGRAVTTASPALRGETIDVMATGLGAVSVPPDAGVSTPAGWTAHALQVPTATIGAAPAPVVSAVLASGGAGVFRVRLTVPTQVAAGAQAVELRVGSATSNRLTLPVQ